MLTILPYGVLNEAVEAQGRQTFLVSFICCLVLLLTLLLIFLKYSKMNHAQLEELATAGRWRRRPASPRASSCPT